MMFFIYVHLFSAHKKDCILIIKWGLPIFCIYKKYAKKLRNNNTDVKKTPEMLLLISVERLQK